MEIMHFLVIVMENVTQFGDTLSIGVYNNVLQEYCPLVHNKYLKASLTTYLLQLLQFLDLWR